MTADCHNQPPCPCSIHEWYCCHYITSALPQLSIIQCAFEQFTSEWSSHPRLCCRWHGSLLLLFASQLLQKVRATHHSIQENHYDSSLPLYAYTYDLISSAGISVDIWLLVSKWLYPWFNYMLPDLFVSFFFHHVPTSHHQRQRWSCVPYHIPCP